MLKSCTRNKQEVMRRLKRQKAFHARKECGDLLVFYNKWDRFPNLDLFLCSLLFENPSAEILNQKLVSRVISEYLSQLRDSYDKLYQLDDDLLPTAVYYTGIGSITAAQAGIEPVHGEDTSWLEPNLDWDKIEQLKFNPDNKWLQFGLLVNNELWRRWEEDFFVLPYLHRSPLDAANGIRGTALFEEMYTKPAKIKALTDYCTNWSLQVEELYNNNIKRPKDWGNGVWGAWLPDNAVFVNGDPVGLISREMMLEFEQPFTEKLFTQTGGGFFHNHTIGLYQVDQVAKTKGTLIQEFATDPKTPTSVDAILEGGCLCDKIIESSLNVPILIEDVKPEVLDILLPIIKNGRFIVELMHNEDTDINTEIPAAIKKVRAASNIK